MKAVIGAFFCIGMIVFVYGGGRGNDSVVDEYVQQEQPNEEAATTEAERLFQEARELEKKANNLEDGIEKKRLLDEAAERYLQLAVEMKHVEAGLRWVEMRDINIQSLNRTWNFVSCALKKGTKEIRLRALYQQGRLLHSVPGNQLSQDYTEAADCYRTVMKEARSVGNLQWLTNLAKIALTRLQNDMASNPSLRKVWPDSLQNILLGPENLKEFQRPLPPRILCPVVSREGSQ